MLTVFQDVLDLRNITVAHEALKDMSHESLKHPARVWKTLNRITLAYCLLKHITKL